MQVVRRHEENAEESGRRALIKDAKKYNMPRNRVWNFNPNPVGVTGEVNGALIGRCAKEN